MLYNKIKYIVSTEFNNFKHNQPDFTLTLPISYAHYIFKKYIIFLIDMTPQFIFILTCYANIAKLQNYLITELQLKASKLILLIITQFQPKGISSKVLKIICMERITPGNNQLITLRLKCGNKILEVLNAPISVGQLFSKHLTVLVNLPTNELLNFCFFWFFSISGNIFKSKINNHVLFPWREKQISYDGWFTYSIKPFLGTQCWYWSSSIRIQVMLILYGNKIPDDESILTRCKGSDKSVWFQIAICLSEYVEKPVVVANLVPSLLNANECTISGWQSISSEQEAIILSLNGFHFTSKTGPLWPVTLLCLSRVPIMQLILYERHKEGK
ncbi:hypothetical protein AGLY_011080 [Aphis glycines]|uniref:Uncharacterized protein n=1 Tax=Aphis glycines TaxID=307491 RepID=A0A6G0TD14_APHGL|nr:hypothetical protein AGLY_011080 [Aphis glycines]